MEYIALQRRPTFFARYVFLHEYENNMNFNADQPSVFVECLKSLQTRPRKNSAKADTVRNRALIDRHLPQFCELYRCQRIGIGGLQSNWELYVGSQMCTAYLNNAATRTGQHFRTILNEFFGVRELRALVRRTTSTAMEKRLAREELDNVAAFKETI
jgi:hypothetical protein